MPPSGPELPARQFGPVLRGGRERSRGVLDLRRLGIVVVAFISLIALFAVGTAGALIVVGQRSIDQIDLANVGDHDGSGADGGQAGDPGDAGGSSGQGSGQGPGEDGDAVEFEELTEVQNILVVGTDSRENLSEEQLLALGTEDDGGTNLTDTVILVQLDPRRDTAALLSFPRDLYVTRCDGTRGRINAAFAIGEAEEDGGGPECLVDTIEDFTDIPIDHYVQVDLAGFINAVDAIGGVTFYVDEPLRDRAAGLDIDEGCVRFDGTKALSFVRARTLDNDFGRIARQQRFVREMVDKVTSAGVLLNPVRLFSLVTRVGGSLTTDAGLGLTTQRDLAFSLRDITTRGLDSRTVPGDIRTVDGASVVVAHEDDAEELFEAFRAGAVIPEDLGRDAPEEITIDDVGPVVVLNGVGVSGRAAEVAGFLEDRGLAVEATDNAENFDFERTEVLHAPDRREEAELVAEVLESSGVDVRLVRGESGSDLTVVAGADLTPDLLADAPEPEPTSDRTRDSGSSARASGGLPPSETPEYKGAQVSGRSC